MIIVMLIMVIVVRPTMSGRGGSWTPRRYSNREHQEIRKGRDFETPLEILKKRYAKGEITKDDYEEMKREL